MWNIYKIVIFRCKKENDLQRDINELLYWLSLFNEQIGIDP